MSQVSGHRTAVAVQAGRAGYQVRTPQVPVAICGDHVVIVSVLIAIMPERESVAKLILAAVL